MWCKWMAPAAVLLAAHAARAGSPADELAKPVRLEAGGKPIDVEIGHASPFFGDFDGDGKPDLLVGQFGEGKLRIYRNEGTSSQPKFDDLAWFTAGDGDELGKVPASWCIGFGPQLVDFDADGHNDLLSGSFPGDLYLFRGRGGGKFSASEIIKGRNDKPINVGSAAAVHAADWDADGDLDLLIGNIDGAVHLAVNEGTRSKPVFGEPKPIDAAGMPIRVGHGDAGPFVADWDGDGLADLIVGAGDGAVRWYRNVGSSTEPKLVEAVTLVEPAPDVNRTEIAADEEPTRSQMRTKPCVADFNGDGRLDLLVGDFSSAQAKPPEKDANGPSAEELQEKLAALSKEFSATREHDKNETDEARQQRVGKLKELSQAMKDARAKLNELRRRPTYVYHGWVWFYERVAIAHPAAGGGE